MPKSRPVLYALTVLLAAALAACGGAAAPGGPVAAASAPAALLLSPADVITLAPSSLATGPVLTGSLQPERRADLRAEISAVVLEVRRDNGDAVAAGDVLVRLDDTAIRDSLNAANEAVRVAQAALAQTDRLLTRQQTLASQGMVSAQALDDAQLRRVNAANELVAARARAAQALQQQARTQVRAPFAGVVSERQVSAGDTASVGKALLKVIDPASLRFEALVSADDAAQLRVGQKAVFRVNGMGEARFDGTLKRIDAAANATTRQVAVVVTFDDAAAAPRVAGLFAEGHVLTASREVLMLPPGAIVRSGDRAEVWRLHGGKLDKVAVQLGERDARSGDWPVRSGLTAGEQVLRNPGSNLTVGQAAAFGTAAKPAAAASGK
ncbi:MAG: efflux RND transporter periplasmic adaptor subunit [Proteobacteria bacterium]|nr:efflux RND transporter periplasmic adaptor subunit [Pseudomonadota bacterium]